ncbi:uncharacterized protein LOC108664524 [Hyalella azteca]|uniref:Uncharacterized protein LOC108664524 n=1 Tax=Hyalella azteca TaxID=294128 RepID=A0A8B7MZB7_HYAAZ|nr:uncharacterized protein LOC108664524 [Hyalella azteca]
MESSNRNNLIHSDPTAKIDGIMFISGYVMSIKDDGTAGILSVRGGGGKFVLFQLSHFYVNKKRVESPHNLFTFLDRRSYLNLFIEDMGEERMIVTFKVRYKSVLCWVGPQNMVPDVGPYSEFWRRWGTLSNELTVQSRYDVYVDVPTASMVEVSGLVYWCCETYGLVSIRCEKGRVKNVLFTADNFYINQKKFVLSENLAYPCADANVIAIAKPMPPVKIFGVLVQMEAVVVFLGKRPDFKLIYGKPEARKPNGVRLPEISKETNLLSKVKYIEENGANKSKASLIWADEDDSDEENLRQQITCAKVPEKKNIIETPNNVVRVASYLTGFFRGTNKGYLMFGNGDNACRFSPSQFFVNGLQFSTAEEVVRHLMSVNKPILHGYVVALERPMDVDPNLRTFWEAVCVWHGPAPQSLKTKINSLKKVPLKNIRDASKAGAVTREVMVDRSDLIAATPQTPFNDAMKKGRLAGFVLSCSASDAILTGFANSVYLTRERFYVHGKKYRGTSLLKFFLKTNEKVNTYIVPMQMKIVRGCAVFRRAICAWVGKEPAELQQMILNDKIYTNFEVSDAHEKRKDTFYYMVGHVQKMGETRGLIECVVDGSTVNVEFSVHELYKYGKKVSSRSILSMHSQVLLTSRWSVLAHCSTEPMKYGAEYTAVAVWHHDDQLLIFEDLQNKIPLWHKKLVDGKCSCSSRVAKLTEKAFSSVSKGVINETNQDAVAVGLKNQGLVWVQRNQMIVDGCVCYCSKIDEQRMCYVAFDSNRSPLYSWIGKITISNSACGSEDDLAHIDCTSDDSDAEHDDRDDLQEDNDDFDEEDVDGMRHNLAAIEMSEPSDPSDLFTIAMKTQSGHKASKTNQRKPSKVGQPELDRFSGRYVRGNIVNIEDELVVLSWHSDDFHGTIFIQLDIKHLYINGEPFKKTCYTKFSGAKVLMEHTCNLYINTIPESRYHGLLEICAVASAGWIGTKPIFLPPPGKQGPGVYDVNALRIAYSNPPHVTIEFNSYQSWLKYLETQRNNENTEPALNSSIYTKVFLENGSHVAQNKSNPSRSSVIQNVSNELRQESAKSAGRVGNSVVPAASVTVSRDKGAVKPPQNIMNNNPEPPGPSAPETIIYDFPIPRFTGYGRDEKDVHEELARKRAEYFAAISNDQLRSSQLLVFDTQPVPTVEASSDEPGFCGSIIELHPMMGRLKGNDDSQHFFKPGQFFLFGLTLDGIELYNILVEGMEVRYDTDEEGQLLTCWYGSRHPRPATPALLSAWCRDNFVSSETHDVMVARANERPNA